VQLTVPLTGITAAHWGPALLLLVVSCHGSPPPANRSPVPGPGEAILTTVNHPDLPVGRWIDLNPGNYLWVARLDPAQRYRIAAEWKSHPRDVQLDLAAVHIDGDLEWDESDLIKKLSVDRRPDGSVSGTLELAPKANAARIKLSRNGDGTDPFSVRIDPM
jgi:hypothetical protein